MSQLDELNPSSDSTIIQPANPVQPSSPVPAPEMPALPPPYVVSPEAAAPQQIPMVGNQETAQPVVPEEEVSYAASNQNLNNEAQVHIEQMRKSIASNDNVGIAKANAELDKVKAKKADLETDYKKQQIKRWQDDSQTVAEQIKVHPELNLQTPKMEDYGLNSSTDSKLAASMQADSSSKNPDVPAVDVSKQTTLEDKRQLEQVDQYTASMKALAKQQEDQDNLHNEAKKRLNDLDTDMQNQPEKVNPNHFWDTRTGPQKLAVYLGAALGGQNFMDNLHKFIDRDVESQKFNIQQKLAWKSKVLDVLDKKMDLYKNRTTDLTSRANISAGQEQVRMAKAAANAQLLQRTMMEAQLRDIKSNKVAKRGLDYNLLPPEVAKTSIRMEDGTYQPANGTKDQLSVFQTKDAAARVALKSIDELEAMATNPELFKSPSEHTLAAIKADLIRVTNMRSILGSGAITQQEWERVERIIANPIELKNITSQQLIKLREYRNNAYDVLDSERRSIVPNWQRDPNEENIRTLRSIPGNESRSRFDLIKLLKSKDNWINYQYE